MTEPVAGIDAVHGAAATLTAEPLWVAVPSHRWVMRRPSGKVRRSVQPLIAAVPVSRRTTYPWNPPGRLPVTR
ncbi:hypothetical protein GCM10010104_30050 [Streptomyces indiaensis]|uniref:Uncharacterized protein n=1 Tax=Streptomyces indiaensis TaxID=284033 RepID=A0ABP5QI04_9ACTN